jgi:hypothetical protein
VNALTNQPPAATPQGPVLRDIHLPPDPSWWPPAPGWWMLAALLIVAVLLGVWWWRRQRMQASKRDRVLAELDQLMRLHGNDSDPSEFASGMHQLLRRVARRHDALAPQQSGRDWRQTLARVPVDATTLDQLMALEQVIYRTPQSFDRATAAHAVRQWLRLALKPSNWKRAGSAPPARGVRA